MRAKSSIRTLVTLLSISSALALTTHAAIPFEEYFNYDQYDTNLVVFASPDYTLITSNQEAILAGPSVQGFGSSDVGASLSTSFDVLGDFTSQVQISRHVSGR